MNKHCWLISYAWKQHGQDNWNYENTVSTISPGAWLVKSIKFGQEHETHQETVLLNATELSIDEFVELKELL